MSKRDIGLILGLDIGKSVLNIEEDIKKVQKQLSAKNHKIKIDLELDSSKIPRVVDQVNNIFTKGGRSQKIDLGDKFDFSSLKSLKKELDKLAVSYEGLEVSLLKTTKRPDGTIGDGLVVLKNEAQQTVRAMFELDKATNKLILTKVQETENLDKVRSEQEKYIKNLEREDAALKRLSEQLLRSKMALVSIGEAYSMNNQDSDIAKRYTELVGTIDEVLSKPIGQQSKSQLEDLKLSVVSLNAEFHELKTVAGLETLQSDSFAKFDESLNKSAASFEQLKDIVRSFGFNEFNSDVQAAEDLLLQFNNAASDEDKIAIFKQFRSAVSDLNNDIKDLQKQNRLSANLNKLITDVAAFKASTNAIGIDLSELDNALELAESVKGSKNVNELEASVIKLRNALTSAKGESKIAYSDLGVERLSKDIDVAYKRLLDFEKRWSAFKSNPELNAQFEKLKADFEGLIAEPNQQGFALIKKRVQEFSADISLAGLKTKDFGDRLRDAFRQLTSYLGATSFVAVFAKGLKDMTSQVIELEDAMSQLRMVTEESGEAYDSFLKSANKRAKELALSTKELVTSSVEFARLGFDTDQALSLAENANVFSKVGFLDAESATTSLISTMKAFDIAAEDSMSIVDKFFAADVKFAVSAEGIGESLQRAASSLSAAGNNLEESIGIITAADEIIQSPEVSGTGVRTIAMRLRNTAGALEELGEDAEGAAESVTKLQTQLLNLTGGRVDIMLDKDTFKNTYEILEEISNVWDSLTDKAQADITRLVAGKYALCVQKCA